MTEINRFEIIEQIESPNTRLDLYLDILREIGGNIAILRNQFAQYWIPAMHEQYERYWNDTEYIMQKIRDLKTEPDERN